ncbi:MAG: MMPL family transporter [bacterium]
MRDRLFHILHSVIVKYPRLVFFLSLLSALGMGLYGAFNMEFITDQDKLLSEDLPYHHRYMEFIRNFGDMEFLYILVEGEKATDEEKIQFANVLAERLRRSEHIKNVIYRLDTSWIRDYALLYASESDLHRLYDELNKHKQDIQQLFSIQSVDQILSRISQSIQHPFETREKVSPDMLQTLIAALQGKADNAFAEFENFEGQILQETQEEHYFWSTDKDFLLMFVLPAKDFSTLSVIEKPLNRIRMDILLTESEFPNVNAGLTGRPALQADEMQTTNEDMTESSIIALLGVTLLFTLFFRELIRPAFAVLTLLIAMGWTYGFVAMTLGHLNLLSTVFALVLIGLGIDFGIHFLSRYQEELKRYNNPGQAIYETLKHTGSGIATGAITSSAAFLTAMLTDFKGLAELGYVAGIGIVFCLIAMLVTLSSMLLTYDLHFRRKEHIPGLLQIWGLRHISRHPRIMFSLIALVTIISIPEVFLVKFDDNMLNMQAEGLESVEYEHKLLEDAEYSSWYAAFLVPDLVQAKQVAEELRTNPTVASVDTLTDVMPENLEQKQPVLTRIRELLQPALEYTPQTYQPSYSVYRSVQHQLDVMFSQMQALQNSPFASQREPSPEILHLQQLQELLSGSNQEIVNRLKRAHEILIQEPKSNLKRIVEMTQATTPDIEELPDIFNTMYIGNDGTFLVMAYPKKDIWKRENLEEFVQEIRKIDPEVTGTPIQIYESSTLMRNSFRMIGLISLAIVTILVFLDFLSITALFFTIFPLLLGVLWLVEIMGIFNIHLNLANFFAIPILIGIGVDNAVHLYHRFLETHDLDSSIATTGTTLTLTSLTTIMGFGSLIFASHKGLSSLGILMAAGTITCWFACVVFMPLTIQLFHAKGKQNHTE